MRLYAAIVNRRLIESQRTGSCVLITRLDFVLLCRCRIRFSFTSPHQQAAARQQLLVCLLNLMAAYDRVSRPLLWDVLGRLSIHGAVLAAVQAIYGSATIAIRVGRRQGPELQSLTGVKKTCLLSPTLFGLLAVGLHAFLQALGIADGIAVANDVLITYLAHADIFCLVSATADGLQRLIDAADAWCAAVGMQAGPAKTHVAHICLNRHNHVVSMSWGAG